MSIKKPTQSFNKHFVDFLIDVHQTLTVALQQIIMSDMNPFAGCLNFFSIIGPNQHYDKEKIHWKPIVVIFVIFILL